MTEKKYLVTCPKGGTIACEEHKNVIVEVNASLGTTVKVEDAEEEQLCAHCPGKKDTE